MGNNQNKTELNIKTIAMAAALAILIGILCFFVFRHSTLGNATTDVDSPIVTDTPDVSDTDEPVEQTPEPTPEATPFAPYAVEETEPDLYLSSTDIMVDGEIIEGDYEAAYEISFGSSDEYTELKGVTTFRGNNYRDTASYGTADITEGKFEVSWTNYVGSLSAPDGSTWTGVGWTGQPLIVEWDIETRQNMNMYDWAKNTETLVEVIQTTMDGWIYFYELETGDATRDAMYLGFTVKGTGTLDPRGYPILYVGGGYTSYEGESRAFIISLIDCSIIYEYGCNDSFAWRAWSMFDSSPLVDAETDTLIHAGENGILYIIRLNSEYDAEAGTVSVEPTVVKWRYYGERTSLYSYWLGFEASPVIYESQIYLADNGGNLICLDLNTLKVNWVQDILDDSNSTPVLEVEDGHPYIYISTSFHSGWRASEYSTTNVPIWKIDAETGEIVWQVDYECYTVSSVSGGVQGSIAIGKNNVSDLIFVPVARTPQASTGQLVALDKTTGEEVWCVDTQMYSWSSPVVFYDDEGNGYIIYCTSGYYIYLLDAETGEKLDSMNIGGNIEASPAVYENYVVIGTRAEQLYGIKMT